MSDDGGPGGREPRTSRPSSPPDYFRARPIAWAWARQRLIEARNYWICSTLRDGRPHARPVWGVWLDDRLYFDTGSRIGGNVTERPDVSVHLESGNEVVIIEGTARRVTDAAEVARFLDAYNPKYHHILKEPPGAVFIVDPHVAFGWLSDPSGIEGGAIFNSTGTRWDFDRE